MTRPTQRGIVRLAERGVPLRVRGALHKQHRYLALRLSASPPKHTHTLNTLPHPSTAHRPASRPNHSSRLRRAGPGLCRSRLTHKVCSHEKATRYSASTRPCRSRVRLPGHRCRPRQTRAPRRPSHDRPRPRHMLPHVHPRPSPPGRGAGSDHRIQQRGRGGSAPAGTAHARGGRGRGGRACGARCPTGGEEARTRQRPSAPRVSG